MYHHVTTLDNPFESRRSFASTAFRDEPGRKLDVPADLILLADDTARCEAAAKPVLFSCPAGLQSGCFPGYPHQQIALWVRSPRTGKTISIPAAHWHELPESVVSQVLFAVGIGSPTASFSAQELREIAAAEKGVRQ